MKSMLYGKDVSVPRDTPFTKNSTCTTVPSESAASASTMILVSGGNVDVEGEVMATLGAAPTEEVLVTVAEVVVLPALSVAITKKSTEPGAGTVKVVE